LEEIEDIAGRVIDPGKLRYIYDDITGGGRLYLYRAMSVDNPARFVENLTKSKFPGSYWAITRDGAETACYNTTGRPNVLIEAYTDKGNVDVMATLEANATYPEEEEVILKRDVVTISDIELVGLGANVNIQLPLMVTFEKKAGPLTTIRVFLSDLDFGNNMDMEKARKTYADATEESMLAHLAIREYGSGSKPHFFVQDGNHAYAMLRELAERKGKDYLDIPRHCFRARNSVLDDYVAKTPNSTVLDIMEAEISRIQMVD